MATDDIPHFLRPLCLESVDDLPSAEAFTSRAAAPRRLNARNRELTHHWHATPYTSDASKEIGQGLTSHSSQSRCQAFHRSRGGPGHPHAHQKTAPPLLVEPCAAVRTLAISSASNLWDAASLALSESACSDVSRTAWH